MFAFLRPAVVAAAVLVIGVTLQAADKRPMKVDDLFEFKRVAAPQISPDGKTVVYQVATVDLAREQELAPRSGSPRPTARRRRSNSPTRKGKKDANPRWSPDGKQVLFESNRSGTSQLWTVAADGGEPKQTHRHQHRGGQRHLVAGRHARRVRVGGVSRSSARSRSPRATS